MDWKQGRVFDWFLRRFVTRKPVVDDDRLPDPLVGFASSGGAIL